MSNSYEVIGVCGAGAMGAGIAQVAAQAGARVVVFDRDDAALERGKATVAKGAAALLKRGKIDEAGAVALEASISWKTNVDVLAGADLVIEAIIEDAGVKQDLFAALETKLREDAVIATNTSSLAVTHLASSLKRPARFLGLHFFNPAPIMKLVEVVSGADTDPAIARECRALMESWGKVAVFARDVPGFIVNRVARPFYGEGWRALEEGAADAATLDFLYKDLAGFRMGPMELGDLIGHDINSAAAKSVFDAYHGRTRFRPALAQEQLVAAGRLGRKSGRGVYDHADGADAPSPFFLERSEQGGEVRLSPNADAPVGEFLRALDVPTNADEDMAPPCATIDGVFVDVTFGPTAKALAAQYGAPFLLLDWTRDPKSARAIAFSASDDAARGAGRRLAAMAGKEAIELTDRPGLVVFRTLAQLANCAADAVRDGVADAGAIDLAMMNGVNYPFGPMAWMREVGAGAVAQALEVIAEWTGDPIYQPSEILRALEIEEG
ncbi:MAG: 3-hydroxyacyl-CoA dehydrogenase NAD-binding domain-containing protein [Pseudomonadota bacterium]